MTEIINYFVSNVSGVIIAMKSFTFNLFGFETNLFALTIGLMFIIFVITLLKRLFGINDFYDMSINYINSGSPFIKEKEKEKKYYKSDSQRKSEIREELRKSR